MTTEGPTGETTEHAELLAAVTELGTALRELVDVSVRTTVPPDTLRDVAATARELTGRLSAAVRERGELPALDDPARFRRVHNPVTGVGSALAPPLDVRRVDGGVAAEVTLGLPYEGPPGYVHGGVSSLLMDQLLGSGAMAAGLWGMTVRLELDYRRPVPLLTPLVLRATVGERAGRRTVVTGRIALASAPDQPLVTAHGVFVNPTAEQAAAYFGTGADGG